jgi:protein SCO1
MIRLALGGAALGLAVLGTWFFWQRPPSCEPAVPPQNIQVGDATLSRESLYQLHSTWTRSDGARIQLHSLSGHFQVLLLMFTQCHGSCPILVKKVQQFAASLPRETQQRVRFVLVSVDPDFDTPKVLDEYRRTMRLDPERWTLLQGAKQDVRELAAVLGFSYDQIDSGEFVHTDLVTLLDPHGAIAQQLTGATTDLTPLATSIASWPPESTHRCRE